MSSAAKCLVTLLLSLALASPDWASQSLPPKRTTLYVLLDGVRPDAVTPAQMPNMERLSRRGARAAMTPVWPSLSRPNHWALVTGLNARSSGIYLNDMYNPRTGRMYATTDPDFAQGEPIWGTLDRHGLQAGVISAWNGVERRGTGAPTFFLPYTWHPPLDGDRRGAMTLEILRQPPESRPDFLALYMLDVDVAQHAEGVGSPPALTALKRIDRVIGEIVAGLESVGLIDQVNIVVVSDHGQMNVTGVVVLSDLIDLEDLAVPTGAGSILALWPKQGREKELLARLKSAGRHLQAYAPNEIPARFNCCRADRVPPILLVAEPGWHIEPTPPPAGQRLIGLGHHGYDNANPAMHALFVAAGPDIRPGSIPGAVQSVDTYSLIAALTGVPPNLNDGSLLPFCSILVHVPEACR